MIMKTSSEGFQQCYNAQMAVDGEHQIIVATQVGPQASDQGRWWGCRSTRRLGSSLRWYWPMRATAEPDLLELEDRGIDAHVALGREGKSQVAVDPARLCHAPHGWKLASPAGKARYAQRKVGGAERVDQGGARIPTIQPARLGEGARHLVCLALKRMGTVATC